MKCGKDDCRFEEMVKGKIRSNVVTYGNIRALVMVVGEQIGLRGPRATQERLEFWDVKWKQVRIWYIMENTDQSPRTARYRWSRWRAKSSPATSSRPQAHPR